MLQIKKCSGSLIYTECREMKRKHIAEPGRGQCLPPALVLVG